MTELENQIRELVGQESLGEDIEKFLNGRVGLFLLKKSEDEAEQATRELLKLAVVDQVSVIRLQERVRAAENFRHWLIEGMQAAENATATLASIESQG